ncbi:MAG: hypothetical protein ACI32C_05830 [Candidatus Enteromonas sp.]
MEEIKRKQKKWGRDEIRPFWIIGHGVLALLWAVLLLAVPMYESKVDEEHYHLGFFFEVPNGLGDAATIVFYVFFFLVIALLAASTINYAISLSFVARERLDRADRFFALATSFFLGANAFMALFAVALNLIIPMGISIVLAALGFLSFFLHAKKFAELAD